MPDNQSYLIKSSISSHDSFQQRNEDSEETKQENSKSDKEEYTIQSNMSMNIVFVTNFI